MWSEEREACPGDKEEDDEIGEEEGVWTVLDADMPEGRKKFKYISPTLDFLSH